MPWELGVAHLALRVRVDLDAHCRSQHLIQRVHHVLGLDGAEAAPVDRAAAGLHSKPRRSTRSL